MVGADELGPRAVQIAYIVVGRGEAVADEVLMVVLMTFLPSRCVSLPIKCLNRQVFV